MLFDMSFSTLDGTGQYYYQEEAIEKFNICISKFDKYVQDTFGTWLNPSTRLPVEPTLNRLEIEDSFMDKKIINWNHPRL